VNKIKELQGLGTAIATMYSNRFADMRGLIRNSGA